MFNHPLQHRVHYIFLGHLCPHFLLKRDMLRVHLEHEVVEDKSIVLVCEDEQAFRRFLRTSEKSEITYSHRFNSDLEVKLEGLLLVAKLVQNVEIYRAISARKHQCLLPSVLLSGAN